MNSYLVLCFVFVIFAAFVKAEYGGYGGEIGGYGGYEHGFESQIGGGYGYESNHVEEEHHEPAKYKFNYAVHDPHTGDEKQHFEERDGDVVKGSYSLKEADGTTRVVEYKADKHNGFNAVVHKIGEPKKEIESGFGGHYGGHY